MGKPEVDDGQYVNIKKARGLLTKNAKISAAVFRTDEDGRTVLKLTLPPDALADMAVTAVTLEPNGESLLGLRGNPLLWRLRAQTLSKSA